MKKVCLLTDKFDLGINLNAALYRFNFRVLSFKSPDEVMADFDSGNRYDIYIFDIKAKNIDLSLVKFIRENQVFTPIMLALDESIPTNFKKIYYAKVDGFIIHDFCMDEILFHIFKLTKTLLGSKFELKDGMVFDKNSLCIWHKSGEIYLGKKEALLLEALAKNSPHVVTFEELVYHVYKGENISQDRLRSVVREIRAKLPVDVIKTVRGVGYKIDTNG